ncbi:MAG TPA: ferritin [Acidimicrobiia bacterium]|nr:ferritin [Acidimicrobiia bacterium]
MRMPDDLEAAFNRQVTMELASATAYLQMAAFFADSNLVGMSAWMRAQAAEERAHADRFLDFILDRGNRVHIGEVPAPMAEFDGPEPAFEAALDQERAVTEAIHALYRLASDRGDLASFPFLQAFIAEQNEEESTAQTILDRLRLASGDSGAIFLLDHELGARGGDAQA